MVQYNTLYYSTLQYNTARDRCNNRFGNLAMQAVSRCTVYYIKLLYNIIVHYYITIKYDTILYAIVYYSIN